ncbi:Aluminum-activated malate transporter protein [Dioscorea alata]|uniref:Aluminum-activated malate transporter protein n=1 Tax=Dioscorea alata TaxID=55571 RepID=A0ACB7VZR2_DIOAL|nr:Aluminum-activated malate transporter protein [Dioscorea alata]
MVIMLFKKVKKIGEDDPRRILHSFKVGLTLTLVCIFYYVTPLFDGFGSSAMWAVLTVAVVMEFTVGGTLCKGLNRTFATLLAGALGLGAHHIAILCGEKGEPILIGIFVFFLSSAATFSRFIPEVKKRYDYGVTIFILTFSLVAVSSYRVEDILEFAHRRLSTIALGVAVCITISTFIFPVWAGGDLHHLTSTNLDKLANFLHGMRNKYFGEDLVDRSYFQSYKSVLNSKATEEALVNLAKWEPGHSGFGFWHPWKQYLVIGDSIRHCACLMDSLATFITTLDKSAPLIGSNPRPKPDTEELYSEIRSACADMSSETAKALSDLANDIKSRSAPATARLHVAAAEAAAERMKMALSNGAEGGIVHVATIGSLVGEITKSAKEIVGSVEELAQLAGFKSHEAVNKAMVKPLADGESQHTTITVDE